MGVIDWNGGELAKWLHDNYEIIAKEVGWNTQDKCKVEFKDLPKENKTVMLRLAQVIQVNLAVDIASGKIVVNKDAKVVTGEVEK